MSSMVDERLTDEIEALQAILLDDELAVIENEKGEPVSIETLIFPSTGEDELSKYVCVKLVVSLPLGYPEVTPSVTLKNPRGLDENTVDQIQKDIEAKCKDFLGQPVMFELIEVVKDHLTKSNLPTGQCVVCLYGFKEQDQFIKTDCFHYFHSHCLSAHLTSAEAYYNQEQDKLPQWQKSNSNGFKAYCPVCREPISLDIKTLSTAPPPIDLEMATEFSVTKELLEMQKKMRELFVYQQQRGGIIDVEAEEGKLLVTTEDSNNASDRSSIPSTSVHSISNTSTQNNLNQNHKRHGWSDNGPRNRGNVHKKDSAPR